MTTPSNSTTSFISSPSTTPTTPLISSTPTPSTQTVTGSPTPTGTTTLSSSSTPTTSVTTIFSTTTASPKPPATTPSVVTLTSTKSVTPTRTSSSSTSSTTSSSPTPAASLSSNNNGSGGGGLSSGGIVAIAVVIPVVVIALLLLIIIFWWRRKKQKKTAEEARRKEVEEYGYNPNEDPTLPAVGGPGSDSPEMSEGTSGYRGWGNTAPSTARKASTNMSSGIGVAMSDDDRLQSPGSQQYASASDAGRSAENRMDGINEADGVTGAAAAGMEANGIHRGPSNASSTYSATGQSEHSDDEATGEHGYETNYSQYTPYRPGASQFQDTEQPVIRNVSARRNTKIENPSVVPRQGNSGIAQNF